MKTMTYGLVVTGVVFGLATATPASAQTSVRGIVANVCEAAASGGERNCGPSFVGDVRRRVIANDVVEYSLMLRVGRGAHDLVGLHRVVRELRPGIARRTPHALLMVHGDLWGFDAAFLPSDVTGRALPSDSAALFLAANDVDVWGIDLRWVHVPHGTTDFSFMRDWSIATHLDDIRTALAVARAVRAATGSGAAPIDLLGWSRGAVLVQAYANAEAAMPEHRRQVNGIILVDMPFTFGPAHTQQRAHACERLAAERPALDAGQDHTEIGAVVQAFGYLASTLPDELSPLIPGLTNRQAALIVAAATAAGDPAPLVPGYHFNAGTFDESGLPTGLRYTNEDALHAVFQLAAPFQSFKETVETDALLCGSVDVPFDDHLGEIRNPVLYVGAAGGVGAYGTDALALLGSTDVTVHIIQLESPGSETLDYGHLDLFTAFNSRLLAWEPIQTWIVSH